MTQLDLNHGEILLRYGYGGRAENTEKCRWAEILYLISIISEVSAESTPCLVFGLCDLCVLYVQQRLLG